MGKTHQLVGSLSRTSKTIKATITMPKALTAENGAKAVLMGEFLQKIPEYCPECHPDNPKSDCEICKGKGEQIRHINVSWTVIKEIYAKAVEHFENNPQLVDK